MRQQIRKSEKGFPPSRSLGQSVIEPTVYDQILAQRIRHRPEIPYRVAALEWLREMPDLAGNRELSQRVRDGKCLPQLRSMDLALNLLGNYRVGIHVKSVKIVTQENQP